MDKVNLFLIIGLMLTSSAMISLVAGDTTPVSAITISGGSSTISSDVNGRFLMEMDTVEPHAKVMASNQEIELPIDNLTFTEPCTSAIILSGVSGNKTVSIIQLSDFIYSNKDKTISFSFTPQKNYNGTVLKDYSGNVSRLHTGKYVGSMMVLAPE